MNAEANACSDTDLVRRSLAGSLPAFEELVSRYEQRIYAFIAPRCHSPSDAREITQDTFVKAFQALHQFDPERNFANWLFTIARRKCIDHLRASPSASNAPVPELPDPNTPAEVLARAEDSATIWSLAARCLSPDQYHALWLRYVEDMCVAEIARVLRKTKTHVKVLLFRARKTLAAHLEPALPPRRATSPAPQPIPSLSPLALRIPIRKGPL